MTNMKSHVRMAQVTHRLREPALCSAIRALQLPPGSRGLDAGCGIGLQAMLLAEAVGAEGGVTGMDLSADFVSYAGEFIGKTQLSERISFEVGDVRSLPFDDDAFDWAWSADMVGYAPLEPIPLIREMSRVVRPGGRVAILAWTSEKLLPGYPVLEARLGATPAGIAPFVKGSRPESHFTRALGWFRAAGLEECAAHTFAGDAHAPLDEDIRSALTELFAMRWPGLEKELEPEDHAEFQRLCKPESPDFILNQPDYYAFFTYSMFEGKVAR